MTELVQLDGRSLTPEDVERIARDGVEVTISKPAHVAMQRSRERIETVLESGEPVYGVTTGFGRLVDKRIDRSELRQLQTNLIRSHAAGVDEALPVEIVRGMLATRANALAKGFSGIRPVVVDRVLDLLNHGIHPIIPRRGSLGASGDLAPLAHLALVLIGEGTAQVDGERMDGLSALESAGLEPIELDAKEGLALINGTQLSLAVGSLLVVDMQRLLDAADVAGALTTEVTMSTTSNCDPAIAAVRPHHGHAAVAANIRRLTAESSVLDAHDDCDRVQDVYSIRCIPQVHGAVRAALVHLREVIEVELNAATDNPLVFARDAVDERAQGSGDAAVLSGGNFHGEPLALPLEYVQGALTEVATISERRLDRLLNPSAQEDYLPPFLAGDPGLESGYMLAQYTSAAMGAQARSIGRPSLDNVTVSGNQEDHVSMSVESALRARETLKATRRAIATELVCACEAAVYLPETVELGVGTDAVVTEIRTEVTPLAGDRPIAPALETVTELIEHGTIETTLDRVLDAPLENTRRPERASAFR